MRTAEESAESQDPKSNATTATDADILLETAAADRGPARRTDQEEEDLDLLLEETAAEAQGETVTPAHPGEKTLARTEEAVGTEMTAEIGEETPDLDQDHPETQLCPVEVPEEMIGAKDLDLPARTSKDRQVETDPWRSRTTSLTALAILAHHADR